MSGSNLMDFPPGEEEIRYELSLIAVERESAPNFRQSIHRNHEVSLFPMYLDCFACQRGSQIVIPRDSHGSCLAKR